MDTPLAPLIRSNLEQRRSISSKFRYRDVTPSVESDTDKWLNLSKAVGNESHKSVVENLQIDALQNLRELHNELDATNWMFETK